MNGVNTATAFDPMANLLPVTLAILNKPDSFIRIDERSGFKIYGWNVLMQKAVFCGKVLEAKVKKKHAKFVE